MRLRLVGASRFCLRMAISLEAVSLLNRILIHGWVFVVEDAVSSVSDG